MREYEIRENRENKNKLYANGYFIKTIDIWYDDFQGFYRFYCDVNLLKEVTE